MNYMEFHEDSERHPVAADRIYQIMDRHGYTLLGEGQDAAVWTKSEAEVIKIIMPEDPAGLDEATQTFLRFYEFCQAHPGYDNLPRFVDIGGAHHKLFNMDGRDYVMTGMERLQPIPRGSFAEAMVWILSDFTATGQRWEQVLPQLTRPDTWDSFTDGMDPAEIISRIRSWDRTDQAKWAVLYTLMVLLYRTGRINHLGWDLHTENAMMRDGEMIVITDPWFNVRTE
jgi:hypothetical protein